MRLQYFSNLHLERFSSPLTGAWLRKKIPPVCPTLVLLGNIGHPFEPHYEIFFRHCSVHWDKVFYVPGHVEYTGKYPRHVVHEQMDSVLEPLSNIHCLRNKVQKHKGFRFVGSTFWSFPKDRKYHFKNYPLDHRAIEFLWQTLQRQEPTIVLTHHRPNFYLLQGSSVHAWLYGDHHVPYQGVLGDKVSIVCNPVSGAGTGVGGVITSEPDFSKVIRVSRMD